MRILFIGGGNMASALIGGMLQRGFHAGDLRAVDVMQSAREQLAQRFGVRANAELTNEIAEEVVLLAVKPQHMHEMALALRSYLRGQLVISIAAGIRTHDLARWLGGHDRIVRAMPNTPALIGSGVSGLFASAAIDQQDRDCAQKILGAVGGVVWVANEPDIDAVTAVSGSGPAYVFYFIEALEQAALELGLDDRQARELAVQTFVGAGALVAGSDDPAAVLRAPVTSKAGTTEAALLSMEAHQIKSRIVEAVHAAARRASELGDQFGKM